MVLMLELKGTLPQLVNGTVDAMLNQGEFIYLRSGKHLILYRYDAERDGWQFLVNREVFISDQPSFSTRQYPWILAGDLLDDGGDVLVLRNESGVAFFKIDVSKSTIVAVSRDSLFGLNESDLLMGRLYSDRKLGFVRRDNTGVKFFAAVKSQLELKIWPMINAPEIVSSEPWTLQGTTFNLADMQRTGQDYIIVRSADTLQIYRFDANTLLQLVTTVKTVNQSSGERFYFADLTKQSFLDILHLNDDGLFTYQFNSTSNQFENIHFDAAFSSFNGWRSEHTESIRLFDVNNDGKDDLIFSGPKGLAAFTFDPFSFTWNSMLDTDHLEASSKFGSFIGAAKVTESKTLLLIRTDEQNYNWGRLIQNNTSVPAPFIEVESEQDDFPVFPVRPNADIPVLSAAPPGVPILRWIEQFAEPSMAEVVDIFTGQVRFSLPIVDQSDSMDSVPLKLAFSYDSSSSECHLLGCGWNVPLDNLFISVNYQGSIHQKDESFQLMFGNSWHQLVPVPHQKDNFTVKQFPEWSIRYERDELLWLITRGVEVLKLGSDATTWSLTWKLWRGNGRISAQDQLISVPTAWYLFEWKLIDLNASLHYSYNKETETVGSGNWTTAVQLVKISDNDQLNINFGYARKSDDEYEKIEVVDDQGNIMLPLALRDSHFLQSVNIETNLYKQTMELTYQKDGKRRLLTAIDQIIANGIHEPIFKFKYATIDQRALLSVVKFPGGSSAEFLFERVPAMLLTKVPDLIAYPVGGSPSIAYGQRFIVLVYRETRVTSRICLKILDSTATKTVVEHVFEVGPGVQSYFADVVSDSYVVIVVEKANEKHVCLLHVNQDDKWQVESFFCRQYSEQVLIVTHPSLDLVIVADAQQTGLELLELSPDRTQWNVHQLKQSVPKPVVAVRTFQSSVVSYDDRQLFICYNDGTQWQTKEYQLPNLVAQGANLIKKFVFTDKEKLITGLKRRTLQVSNSAVMLTGLRIDEGRGQLFIDLHLFILDEQYNLVHEHISVPRDNILDVRFPWQINPELSVQLAYELIAGQYRVRVVSVKGKLPNPNLSEADNLKHMNEELEKEKRIENCFLLDWSSYETQFTDKGAQCGDDVQVIMTGTRWVKETKKSKKDKEDRSHVPLGPYFALKFTDKDNSHVQLVARNASDGTLGSLIHNMKVDQFTTKFPVYLAYQNASSAEVIMFDGLEKVENVQSWPGEQLLSNSSNSNWLVTLTGEDWQKPHCQIRPVFRLKRHPERVVLAQLTVSAGSIKRSISYERRSSVDKKVSAETVLVIPASNKLVAGWSQKSLIMDIQSGAQTTENKIFDSDGRLVQAKTEENQKDDSAEKSKVNHCAMYDRSGRWLISDFTPYKPEDGAVAYFGFEKYERNEIGSTGSWKYNVSNVVRDGFSLTGQNYLHLKDKDRLEKMIRPKDQSMSYVASSWIRLKNSELKSGQPLSQLSAEIETEDGQKVIPLFGQCKRRTGNWLYIELVLDFDVIRQIYREFREKEPGSWTEQDDRTRFSFKLRIEAEKDQWVDVDHIRFTPLTLDFKASVYHAPIGKATAIIQANGLISRTIYDRRTGRELAVVEDTGRVEELTTGGHSLLPNHQASTISLEPKNGFYETFDAHSLSTRWSIERSGSWRINSGRLWHQDASLDTLSANPLLFSSDSVALRCFYWLVDDRASLRWKWIGADLLLKRTGASCSAKLNASIEKEVSPLPNGSEILLMVEKERFFLWVGGNLVMDFGIESGPKPWSQLTLEAQGNVLIEDCIFMTDSRVQIDYLNAFGETVQSLDLESATSVITTQTLYDELGRLAITTKPTRVTRQLEEPLLTYNQKFVTATDPIDYFYDPSPRRLNGEVDQLNAEDNGFAYSRTIFDRNPLNEKRIQGLPGRDFAAHSRFAMKYSGKSTRDTIITHFPPEAGYRHRVEVMPNGSEKTAVYDLRENRVALYVYVVGYDHLLTTYEYDEKGNLVKTMPPVYHRNFTFAKSEEWKFGQAHLTPQELESQIRLGKWTDHSSTGKLIRKKTPDEGTFEYLYDSADRMRFLVHLGIDKTIDHVTYFQYGARGEMIQTGQLLSPPNSTVELEPYATTGDIPEKFNATVYQLFDRQEGGLTDPLFRGRTAIITTNNSDGPLVEKITWTTSKKGQIASKKTFANYGRDVDAQFSFSIQNTYRPDGLVHSILYPTKLNGRNLKVIYTYNKLGRLVAMTVDGLAELVRFTYHGHGKQATQEHRPGTEYTFKRHFKYNSPGFLTEISDRFLELKLEYIRGGYGQDGFGEGIIMQAAFNATWPQEVDWKWFRLDEKDFAGIDPICIDALKGLGYLTRDVRPIKELHPGIENSLPWTCRSDAKFLLLKLLASKLKPDRYGYSYSYGNHQELVAAKYWTRETEQLIEPLMPDTFSLQTPLTKDQSRSLWKELVAESFIMDDQRRSDWLTALGKRGTKSMVGDVKSAFQALDDPFDKLEPFSVLVENLIATAIGQGQSITQEQFRQMFLKWNVPSRVEEQAATRIFQALQSKGLLSTASPDIQALNSDFKRIVAPYLKHVKDVVRVLVTGFGYQLGAHPFDLRSYRIDANGNHRVFSNGLEIFEMSYQEFSNRLSSIKIMRPDGVVEGPYPVEHDSRGNIISAMHKGIQRIDYDQTSQRTTCVVLSDGRKVRFAYDSQGERIFKQVLEVGGRISHETSYVRDEEGRVLMDRRITWPAGSLSAQVTSTSYVYGPGGLLAFIRNGNIFNVLTDHSGSVRLVVHNGRVVAAYDYLPYGKLMRTFGTDPEAQVSYLYTGQELDAETGLYNFHARLYDPDIGRFFQPDPREQYASPYKYAGNSISLVDPECEFEDIQGVCAESTTEPADPVPDGADLAAGLTSAVDDDEDVFQDAVEDFDSFHTWTGMRGCGKGNYHFVTDPVPSSASRHLSWIDRIYISGVSFLNHVTWSFSSTQTNQQSTETSDLAERPVKAVREASLHNCYSTSAESITCYSHQGRSFVFVKSPSPDTGSPPFNETMDTFTNCLPVEWYGKPSVTCSGERTTFIHTPQSQANPLEIVNSWLLLARALPGMWRQVVAFASHISSVFKTKPPKKTVSSVQKENWLRQLEQLEHMLDLKSTALSWATPLVQDLRHQIINEQQAEDQIISLMTEQLVALKEDMQETIDMQENQIFKCHEYPQIESTRLTEEAFSQHASLRPSHLMSILGSGAANRCELH